MTNLHYITLWIKILATQFTWEMDTPWQQVTRGREKQCFGAHAVHISKSGPKMLLMDMFYSVTLTVACITRSFRRSVPLDESSRLLYVQ